jgi:thiol:disulfide interchange protein
MKDLLRLVLAFISLAVAYVAIHYAQVFTLVPLGHGYYEATPLTMIAFFVVFSLTAVGAFVIGNIFIIRHFRSDKSKRKTSAGGRHFPSTEEMLREDRER